MNRTYGWKRDKADARDLILGVPMPGSYRLPDSVDLRPMCPPVKDQGQASSCTGNAIGGMLEYLHRKEGQALDLSRLFIYYNERAIEHTVKEDSGAMIRDGIKSVHQLGVCSEAEWPYDLKQLTRKPAAKCYEDALANKITSYHRLAGLHSMMYCLAKGYPFVFGFTVFESFESEQVAKTGVLEMPGQDEQNLGGHAIMCVGYDQAAKRLLIRNSWGAAWGQGGYFTMPFDYATRADLADDFWTVRR